MTTIGQDDKVGRAMHEMRASRRLDSRWWDLAGVFGAALLGATAVVLLLGSQRADVIFFGADSTVMPLVQRGIERGDPFEWQMTSTIFAVEIPIYALISLFVKNSIAQVLFSGFVNFMLLYAMLRWLAGVIAPAGTRAARVAVSLVVVAIPALAVALEVSTTVRTVEFASMLLATSYYYPVLIGMFFAVTLVARLVQIGDPSLLTFRWPAAGLGVATAILVVSNPLFAGWAVVPVSLTLTALAWRRGLARGLVVWTIGAMGVGVVAALITRELLGDMVGRDASKYVGGVGEALSYYYRETLLGSASTWRGLVEMLLIALLVALSVYGAVRAFRQQAPMELLFAALTPPVIVAVVIFGAIATGAGAARYLQPVLFAPLISLVVIAELWRRTRAQSGEASPARWPQRAGVALAVLLVVGGTASTMKLAGYSSTARYTATDCLMDWIDGRDLTGAGGFWIARPMTAFGPKELQLVQMDVQAGPAVWMTNKYDYAQDREITFVLVEKRKWFPNSPDQFSDEARMYRQVLGEPQAITSCDTDKYWIFDYADTKGAEIMTKQLSGVRK